MEENPEFGSKALGVWLAVVTAEMSDRMLSRTYKPTPPPGEDGGEEASGERVIELLRTLRRCATDSGRVGETSWRAALATSRASDTRVPVALSSGNLSTRLGSRLSLAR